MKAMNIKSLYTPSLVLCLITIAPGVRASLIGDLYLAALWRTNGAIAEIHGLALVGDDDANVSVAGIQRADFFDQIGVNVEAESISIFNIPGASGSFEQNLAIEFTDLDWLPDAGQISGVTVAQTTGAWSAPSLDPFLLTFTQDSIRIDIGNLGGLPFADDGSVTLSIDTVHTATDTDADGVPDSIDNCIFVANADQADPDGDGHGRRCDGDFNQSCSVNAIDLGLFKSRFFTTDPDANHDGVGVVNVIDLGIFKLLFFQPMTNISPAGALCTP